MKSNRLRFLITAGPTREFIDPVRFLSNRSTGKMGFALAEAAAAAGHAVTLVAGPVALPTPHGITRIDVVSARDMLAALQAALPAADVLIMAAAVADFRPAACAAAKLKKSAFGDSLSLVPNPDILKTLAPLKGGRYFAGFAAETGDPLPEARRKLAEKGLDLIVANDVSRPDAGFAAETNRVTLLAPGAEPLALPLMSKREAAGRIVAFISAAAFSIVSEAGKV